jgi:Na+/melibiose symporter-like transporter
MLTRGTLLRYGILGLPLAFAGLPVYVHVPKFYAEEHHVDLAVLGSILLFIRLFDAVLDPMIGVMSDRFHRFTKRIMALTAPLLVVSYIALFNPPAGAVHPVFWLIGSLTLVYISFSTLMINYYTLGVGMAASYHDHTRIAAFREGSMLGGVLLASLLPPLLMQHFPVQQAYFTFSLVLAPLMLVGVWVCLTATPVRHHEATGPTVSFLQLLKSHDVRWVLFIGFCNAIPTAITSTLFMFFTADILHEEQYSGPMLAVYFLSAAAGMPIWTRLSLRYGKRQSLLIAMIVAIICFVWAWGLHAGDLVPFIIICILSGLTLGADSMLLPSLLADTLSDKQSATATGFGLWNLTSKLTMAFAAGISLPLLSFGGYAPGAANGPAALAQLSLCYALLPCLFKAIAVSMLYMSPIDQRRTV